MRNFLATVFSFFMLLPAKAETAAWGIETWECAQQLFKIRLGGGGDILLKSISGTVSATSLPGSSPDGDYVRQVLFSVLAAADLGQPPNAQITETPTGGRVNHSLDKHLLGVNIKQRGRDGAHVFINHTFANPVIIPGGNLIGYTDTQTYQVGGNVYTPEECLNTEAHLTIEFETVP